MSATLYETLKVASRGGTNQQIADEMGVRRYTVQGRMQRLYRYFDVPNRTALVALAHRERIV